MNGLWLTFQNIYLKSTALQAKFISKSWTIAVTNCSSDFVLIGLYLDDNLITKENHIYTVKLFLQKFSQKISILISLDDLISTSTECIVKYINARKTKVALIFKQYAKSELSKNTFNLSPSKNKKEYCMKFINLKKFIYDWKLQTLLSKSQIENFLVDFLGKNPELRYVKSKKTNFDLHRELNQISHLNLTKNKIKEKLQNIKIDFVCSF